MYFGVTAGPKFAEKAVRVTALSRCVLYWFSASFWFLWTRMFSLSLFFFRLSLFPFPFRRFPLVFFFFSTPFFYSSLILRCFLPSFLFKCIAICVSLVSLLSDTMMWIHFGISTEDVSSFLLNLTIYAIRILNQGSLNNYLPVVKLRESAGIICYKVMPGQSIDFFSWYSILITNVIK